MPVAEYVRMSTDHQRYSTANQSALIRRYADSHDMEIVRTYLDAGRSGLKAESRPGLTSLILDVVSGAAPFRAVLVYDVSRWGRFQDVDESAHYEFICRCRGIRVIYCAERFANDGTPLDSVLKALKRAMAGEYSRELSAKVFAGQTQLIRLGYRQGGFAGYGLRRQVLDDGKTPGVVLSQGQRKGLQTDRVVLIPGPVEEIKVVRRIYRDFIYLRSGPGQIAKSMNREGLVDHRGLPWTRYKVDEILTNEKYVGNNVYSRHASKLKTRQIKNRPEDWVRCDNAFLSVVPAHLFEAARKVREFRNRRFTDAEIIAALKELLAREGVLNGTVIDADPNLPSRVTIGLRFGGLQRALKLIGYVPQERYRFHAIDRELKGLRLQYQEQFVSTANAAGVPVTMASSGLIAVDKLGTIQVVVSRCQRRHQGPTWRFLFANQLTAQFTLVVRMEPTNTDAKDLLLLTAKDVQQLPLHINHRSECLVLPFRFASLRAVVNALRTRLREAGYQ